MTFLEICQAVVRESQIAGAGPATVLSPTGKEKDVINWVKDKWVELQASRMDWKWMHKSAAFDSVAGQIEYDPASFTYNSISAPVTDVGEIYIRTLRKYNGATLPSNSWVSGSNMTYEAGVNDNYLRYYNFEDFNIRNAQGVQQQKVPGSWAISPNETILLNYPDDAYEFIFEYHQEPVVLAANADTPGMPSRFHNLLVWMACMEYAIDQGFDSLYARAKANYDSLLGQLMRSQVPHKRTFFRTPGLKSRRASHYGYYTNV